MAEHSVIGKRTLLQDGRAKITGSVKYLPDMHLPGTLHARLVTSLYPHTRINGVDASAALKTPGVVAVITAADLPEIEPSSRTRLLFLTRRHAAL